MTASLSNYSSTPHLSSVQLIALFQSIVIWQQLVTEPVQAKAFFMFLAKSSPKEASRDAQSLIEPHLLHYEPS